MNAPKYQLDDSQSEARWQFALAGSDMGVWDWQVQAGEVFFSERLFTMLGYAPGELSQKMEEWTSRVHPEDLHRTLSAVRDQLDGRTEFYDIEYRMRAKDGTYRWIHDRGKVISRDAENRPLRMAGTHTDITERKRAEQTALENEERFLLLARATNDAVWDWDLLTDEVWWNEGFEKLFGYRREEVDPTVKSWTNHIHPNDLERVVRGVRAVIDGSATAWTDEYRFRCRDGSYAFVLDRGQVIRDVKEKAVRMIGGMTDLTERKRAEEKLQQQATLLDKARDAIVVRDLAHHVQYWNRSAERLYGWSAEEAIGRSVEDLLYADPTAFLAATETTLQAGEWVGEIEQHTKDGRALTIEGHWSLVRDVHDRPEAILAINTDVTERKKLERQFLRAQRMESIGTLAGGIAHDLNNVFGPIIMSLDLLGMRCCDEESRELLEIIQTSAHRGADMVSQVLSFARGVEGQRLEVQVPHLIREIEKIANDTFLKNLTVRIHLPKEIWAILGDPTQLHQVLLNLCVNARDAMPQGGMLTLSAENLTLDAHYAGLELQAKPGPYVRIEVEDTGTGMPPETVEKIFDPFFTTKEVGKGTGLGLSTSLAIVKSHGGFIRVHSEIGKGTRFSIYLPAQGVAGALSQGEEKAEMPRGNGELILVVDDEESVRQVTKQTLEAFGYRVVLANDGTDAIAQYAQSSTAIAAVLTDMMMPGLDGPATIQVLQKLNAQLPILAASGVASKEHVTKAASLGVKHFLPKPYTARTMLQALRDALPQPG